MYEQILRNRLLALLKETDISEYELSLELGRCQGYIHSITSARNLPSMKAFFEICNYFRLKPEEFFDLELNNPTLVHKLTNRMKMLSDQDLNLVLEIVERLGEP